MEKKLKAVSSAYITYKKGDNEIWVLNTEHIDKDTHESLLAIQYSLDVQFEQAYEIMATACGIIAENTLEYINSDECDFFADADSQANVYTGVQLSYLNVQNEGEISELMKDESFTSIASACSVWHSTKVAEACEALKAYINA